MDMPLAALLMLIGFFVVINTLITWTAATIGWVFDRVGSEPAVEPEKTQPAPPDLPKVLHCQGKFISYVFVRQGVPLYRTTDQDSGRFILPATKEG